jgi:regulator of protease activity HflC (stomatin/prohibitin superfamily)
VLGFERILDWIERGWSRIKPFFEIDVYEKAGVMRFGHFHRKVGPGGLHWKIPFFEHVIEITAVETTWRSIAQPLTTKDGATVAISTVVRYEVEDVEPYIVAIYDQHDVLADRTMGLVRRLVAKRTFQELLEAEEPEKEIATQLRRAVHKYGFRIHDVTFTAFTKARPIMWITQSTAASLDN